MWNTSLELVFCMTYLRYHSRHVHGIDVLCLIVEHLNFLNFFAPTSKLLFPICFFSQILSKMIRDKTVLIATFNVLYLHKPAVIKIPTQTSLYFLNVKSRKRLRRIYLRDHARQCPIYGMRSCCQCDSICYGLSAIMLLWMQRKHGADRPINKSRLFY